MIPRAVAGTIRARLFRALHLGLLKPGARLPSVRDLGRELGSDPRVVLAAYGILEQEGLVEIRERSGVFVAGAAGARIGHSSMPAEWMVDVLVRGLAHGVAAPQLPQGLRRCLETLRLHAVVVECNADQLYSVPAELRRDYGLEVTALNVDDLPAHPPPELRRADLLVTTMFHKAPVERLAAALGAPRIIVTMSTDLFAGVARLLPEMPVYFVVVDPRFAAKLQTIFGQVKGAETLRPLVVGRDDLGVIPDAAPTYLTPLARQQIGETALLERALPEPRVFSAESARQVLAFLVRANLEAGKGAGRTMQ